MWRLLGCGFVIATFVASGHGLWRLSRPVVGPSAANAETRRQFELWSLKSDELRAGLLQPFEPVRAQALGLFNTERSESIREWGLMPLTGRWSTLQVLGRMPNLVDKRNDDRRWLKSPYARAAERRAVPGLRFRKDPDRYLFSLVSFQGDRIVAFELPLAALREKSSLRIVELLSGIVPLMGARAGLRLADGTESRGGEKGVRAARLLSVEANHYTQSLFCKMQQDMTVDGTSLQLDIDYVLRLRGSSLELSVRLKSEPQIPGSRLGFKLGRGTSRSPEAVLTRVDGSAPIFATGNGHYVRRQIVDTSRFEVLPTEHKADEPRSEFGLGRRVFSKSGHTLELRIYLVVSRNALDCRLVSPDKIPSSASVELGELQLLETLGEDLVFSFRSNQPVTLATLIIRPVGRAWGGKSQVFAKIIPAWSNPPMRQHVAMVQAVEKGKTYEILRSVLLPSGATLVRSSRFTR